MLTMYRALCHVLGYRARLEEALALNAKQRSWYFILDKGSHFSGEVKCSNLCFRNINLCG